MSKITRRAFTGLVGAGTVVSLTPVPGQVPGGAPALSAQGLFPSGFAWGSATASYQVEGAVHEQGRGVSIWDTFSHTPGKTFHGETGDVADDHFHRYKEDIALMKALGVTAYRFSVAWPRVFPQGTGAANPQGLDFYNRMLDALLAAGIEPFCTLYHWDLPQALEDKGGWQSRDTAEAFAAYAGYTAGKLSDRVKHFMTMNEMSSFVYAGYKEGKHAPGLKLPAKAVAQVAHHAVLGHGLAVGAIRAAARPGTKVGLAESVETIIPVIDTPEHVAAAGKAMLEENATFMTAIQTGRYTDAYLKRLGADAPAFTTAEMKAIGSPVDFIGINIYTGHYVRADESPLGYARVPRPSSSPHMVSDWLYVTPEAMFWGPILAAKVWGVKAIYITENGCSSNDTLNAAGHVEDTDRVMYLRSYLGQLQRALTAGAPVKGYFLWSLVDNFEWAEGYSQRFGLHYVDFATQKRTPKLSAEFYRTVIARNGLA